MAQNDFKPTGRKMGKKANATKLTFARMDVPVHARKIIFYLLLVNANAKNVFLLNSMQYARQKYGGTQYADLKYSSTQYARGDGVSPSTVHGARSRVSPTINGLL